MRPKLAPEELNQWIQEKFMSLHRTVLHKDADEIVLNVLEVSRKLGLKLLLNLPLRYDRGTFYERKNGEL